MQEKSSQSLKKPCKEWNRRAQCTASRGRVRSSLLMAPSLSLRTRGTTQPSRQSPSSRGRMQAMASTTASLTDSSSSSLRWSSRGRRDEPVSPSEPVECRPFASSGICWQIVARTLHSGSAVRARAMGRSSSCILHWCLRHVRVFLKLWKETLVPYCQSDAASYK